MWLEEQIQRFFTSIYNKQNWAFNDYFIYFYNFSDTWFDDSKVLQHLNFQKEVFSIFEKFPLNHKVYVGDYNTFDLCEKGIIVFNLPKISLKAIRYCSCMFQTSLIWRRYECPKF
jgi:hypothetical protein